MRARGLALHSKTAQSAISRNFLRPGDVLVVNDTRVIPARLVGIRARGENVARIEATLIKREGSNLWRALAKPGKRIAPGDRIRFGESSESMACLLASLDADVVERDEGEVLLSFHLDGAHLDEAIERLGHMPLPPYIAARRADDDRDAHDYQTIFAREAGAVAAPTAGLHFTPDLLAGIEARGVAIHRVTLHVGAGTFLPVKVEDTDAHVMHSEWGSVSAETAAALNAARKNGGRIVAVGTTALRILESATTEGGRGAALFRRHVHLHHARLPLSRRRRADDQFPPAALDAVHAGQRLRRARYDAGGLRACDRAKNIASTATATPAC